MLAWLNSTMAAPMAIAGHALLPAPNGRSSKCCPVKSMLLFSEPFRVEL
jgi:hypothetical protein